LVDVSGFNDEVDHDDVALSRFDVRGDDQLAWHFMHGRRATVRHRGTERGVLKPGRGLIGGTEVNPRP
jgi:hypothetical protein